MKLYHYTRYHTLCKYIIPFKRLKFSSILNTNDPSESNPKFIYGESCPTKLLNDNADYYSQMFREEYRKYKFISFCSNRGGVEGFKISSMWAHYGNNHKGVCIEIDTDLLGLLSENLKQYNNYKIINDDILKVDIEQDITMKHPSNPEGFDAVCAKRTRGKGERTRKQGFRIPSPRPFWL